LYASLFDKTCWHLCASIFCYTLRTNFPVKNLVICAVSRTRTEPLPSLRWNLFWHLQNVLNLYLHENLYKIKYAMLARIIVTWFVHYFTLWDFSTYNLSSNNYKSIRDIFVCQQINIYITCIHMSRSWKIVVFMQHSLNSEYVTLLSHGHKSYRSLMLLRILLSLLEIPLLFFFQSCYSSCYWFKLIWFHLFSICSCHLCILHSSSFGLCNSAPYGREQSHTSSDFK